MECSCPVGLLQSGGVVSKSAWFASGFPRLQATCLNSESCCHFTVPKVENVQLDGRHQHCWQSFHGISRLRQDITAPVHQFAAHQLCWLSTMLKIYNWRVEKTVFLYVFRNWIALHAIRRVLLSSMITALLKLRSAVGHSDCFFGAPCIICILLLTLYLLTRNSKNRTHKLRSSEWHRSSRVPLLQAASQSAQHAQQMNNYTVPYIHCIELFYSLLTTAKHQSNCCTPQE